jgi:hypothetical protein
LASEGEAMSFVDVDFEANASGRVLATKPRRDKCGAVYPVFEESIQEIPQSQWGDLVAKADAAGGMLDRLVTRIYDQGQEGSCASNATSQSNEILQATQLGKNEVVHLSAISLYKRVGGNAQSGSVISDNLDEMVARGILPLDTEENRKRFTHTMPATGFSTPFPGGWEATGKQFGCQEWFDIATTAGFATALLIGMPVVYGRQGHAICGCRLVNRNGVWTVKYANSWGAWGDSGYGYDTLQSLAGVLGSYGAFAPRSLVYPQYQLAA